MIESEINKYLLIKLIIKNKLIIIKMARRAKNTNKRNIITTKNILSFFYLTIYFYLFQIIYSVDPDPANLQLIFVYQHIRHGARGPSASYNSLFKDGVDEFKVSWKGEGDGELTLLGKREHYDIGVRNRHKYGHGEHGLGLIDFSTYDPEEVLFHVTDYNRTHQSLNSELIGMYQPGLLKTLTKEQRDGSFPPNEKVWLNKSKENVTLYKEILKEIEELGNKTIVDNIPIFNVHPFAVNRIFNIENNCHNLDYMRKESVKENSKELFEYFLTKAEELRVFFGFDNISFVTDVRMMNSITDHYISDYKNFKDLSIFRETTKIDSDEFMKKSEKFYHDWMYYYYCPNETCKMESSRLMEDLLGYMERRIDTPDLKKSYKAPKMVIDCGHDTTVAPMQYFMYKTWQHKPEYNITTQYCGFACNIYFELYKTKDDKPTYYVYYYIDDDLKHIFEYEEFVETVKNNIITQEQIAEFCITDEEKEERERKNREETFAESFEKNKILWIAFFSAVFTTLLGIIGIIVLCCKIRKINSPKQAKAVTGKVQELTSKFITSSEAQA